MPAWRQAQIASTVALVVAVVGLVIGADFAWWAFIASGVLFLVELALRRSG